MQVSFGSTITDKTYKFVEAATNKVLNKAAYRDFSPLFDHLNTSHIGENAEGFLGMYEARAKYMLEKCPQLKKVVKAANDFFANPNNRTEEGAAEFLKGVEKEFGSTMSFEA